MREQSFLLQLIKWTSSARRLSFLTLVMCGQHCCLGQFTYLSASTGYGLTTFESGGALGNGATISNAWIMKASILHRPLRNLGIGVSFEAPVFQQFTSSFKNSKTPDGSTFRGFGVGGSASGRYVPERLEYEVTQGASFSGIIRLYFETKANSYFEVRITSAKWKEHFYFQRDYVPPEFWSDGELHYELVSELTLRSDKEYRIISPGFFFGLSPHITKRLFGSLELGCQLHSFSRRGFSYKVEHNYVWPDYRTEYVTIQSKLTGTKLTSQLTLGLGYYF